MCFENYRKKKLIDTKLYLKKIENSETTYVFTTQCETISSFNNFDKAKLALKIPIYINKKKNAIMNMFTKSKDIIFKVTSIHLCYTNLTTGKSFDEHIELPINNNFFINLDTHSKENTNLLCIKEFKIFVAPCCVCKNDMHMCVSLNDIGNIIPYDYDENLSNMPTTENWSNMSTTENWSNTIENWLNTTEVQPQTISPEIAQLTIPVVT